LNRALDASELRSQECSFNAGLAACIPEEMPRQGLEMALDCHNEPFYGKTELLQRYTCRGEGKQGTTHFYRIARLYVIWRQVRITLTMTYVLPEDGNLAIVQRLLQRMQHLGFRPRAVYMDKAFCETAIIRYLTQANIPAVIACPIRGKQAGTRALCRGRKAYLTNYVQSDGTPARLAVVLSLSRQEHANHHRSRIWTGPPARLPSAIAVASALKAAIVNSVNCSPAPPPAIRPCASSCSLLPCSCAISGFSCAGAPPASSLLVPPAGLPMLFTLTVLSLSCVAPLKPLLVLSIPFLSMLIDQIVIYCFGLARNACNTESGNSMYLS
jgi:hypothetical protein